LPINPAYLQDFVIIETKLGNIDVFLHHYWNLSMKFAMPTGEEFFDSWIEGVLLLNKSFVFVLLFSLLISILSPSVYADWARNFVVFSGKTYEITDKIIDPNNIDKKIGKVTSNSTREGSYRGNFSNKYPKGTEYYSIKGIDSSQEIAVKASVGGYLSAIYRGEYGEKSNLGWYIVWIFLACIVTLLAWPATYKRHK